MYIVIELQTESDSVSPHYKFIQYNKLGLSKILFNTFSGRSKFN